MTARVVGAVVVAAGAGERLGTSGPKALVEVAGAPLVVHAVRALARAGVDEVVVVHPPGVAADFAAALDGCDGTALVPGGRTRTDSVRAGVEALDDTVRTVAVHDAARPLMPVDVIADVLAALAGDAVAAAPGLPIADTVKHVRGGNVLATLDRSELVAIQTPQVFRLDALRAALDLRASATDELALVERLVADGRLTGRIAVVPGSAWGRKITFPEDLAIVEALAALRPEPWVSWP